MAKSSIQEIHYTHIIWQKILAKFTLNQGMSDQSHVKPKDKQTTQRNPWTFYTTKLQWFTAFVSTPPPPRYVQACNGQLLAFPWKWQAQLSWLHTPRSLGWFWESCTKFAQRTGSTSGHLLLWALPHLQTEPLTAVGGSVFMSRLVAPLPPVNCLLHLPVCSVKAQPCFKQQVFIKSIINGNRWACYCHWLMIVFGEGPCQEASSTRDF